MYKKGITVIDGCRLDDVENAIATAKDLPTRVTLMTMLSAALAHKFFCSPVALEPLAHYILSFGLGRIDIYGQMSPNVRTGKRRDDETDDRSHKSALGPHIDVIIHIELFNLISRRGGGETRFSLSLRRLLRYSLPALHARLFSFHQFVIPFFSFAFFFVCFFLFFLISWQTPRIFLFWTTLTGAGAASVVIGRDVVSPFIFSCEAAGFSLVCFFLSENSMLRLRRLCALLFPSWFFVSTRLTIILSFFFLLPSFVP